MLLKAMNEGRLRQRLHSRIQDHWRPRGGTAAAQLTTEILRRSKRDPSWSNDVNSVVDVRGRHHAGKGWASLTPRDPQSRVCQRCRHIKRSVLARATTESDSRSDVTNADQATAGLDRLITLGGG